jgi:hypothetical protein
MRHAWNVREIATTSEKSDNQIRYLARVNQTRIGALQPLRPTRIRALEPEMLKEAGLSARANCLISPAEVTRSDRWEVPSLCLD